MTQVFEITERTTAYTIQDVVDWVLEHRKNKVYRGWKPAEIAGDIERAIKAKAFVFTTDPDGRLVGIVSCTPHPLEKTLRVNHILTTAPHVVPLLLAKYRAWYAGWTITAKRRGKEKVYNTDALVRRLERT